MNPLHKTEIQRKWRTNQATITELSFEYGYSPETLKKLLIPKNEKRVTSAIKSVRPVTHNEAKHIKMVEAGKKAYETRMKNKLIKEGKIKVEQEAPPVVQEETPEPEIVIEQTVQVIEQVQDVVVTSIPEYTDEMKLKLMQMAKTISDMVYEMVEMMITKQNK